MNESQAFRRVEQLRKTGRWPGVVIGRDGNCRLTADPDLPAAEIADLEATSGCPPYDQAKQGGNLRLPVKSTGGNDQ